MQRVESRLRDTAVERLAQGLQEILTPVIAVDTNALVRLLVKDDAAQTRKVREFFKQLDAGETAFV